MKCMIICWVQFEQISDVFEQQLCVGRIIALDKRQYIAIFHISTRTDGIAMHTGAHLDFLAREHCILARSSMLLEFLS